MELLSFGKQRELIAQLVKLILDRSTSEVSIQNSIAARDETTNSQFDADRQRILARQATTIDALRREQAQALEDALREFDVAGSERQATLDSSLVVLQEQFEAAAEIAKRERRNGLRACETALAAGQNEIEAEKTRFEQQMEEYGKGFDPIEAEIQKVLFRRRCRRKARKLPPKTGATVVGVPVEQYRQSLQRAAACPAKFQEHMSHRFLADGWPFFIAVLVALAAVFPVGQALTFDGIEWIVVCGGIGVLAGLIAWRVARPIVVSRTLEVYEEFQQAKADGLAAVEAAIKAHAAYREKKHADLQARFERDVTAVEARFQAMSGEADARRQASHQEALDEFEARRNRINAVREQKLKTVKDQYQARIAEAEQRYRDELQQLSDKHQQDLDANHQQFERSWTRLIERWTAGIQQFQAAVNEMHGFCDGRFPDVRRIDWTKWEPTRDAPRALPFGHFEVDLAHFEHGMPDHPDLFVPRTKFDLPAALQFPACPSLLLLAWGEGRNAASQTLRNAMLRYLTAFPPGKVRFTIIDPTGLGQNFSAFMHLTDFDDRLVHNRIWTEPNHIQQRLTDLTAHMESVIQKYLRNDFASINEYNEHAGEVAEAFQVLVIANFPAGFTDEAAGRLVSIVNSGARCGVYTLISVDSRLDLPRNFDLDDLERNAASLQWTGDRFAWVNEELRDFPLTLDPPPDDDVATRAIKAVGRRAVDAFRVEVPFSTVAPAGEWWTGDSRSSVEVPLGRAGASKLQSMRLGKGTSQHVLISGKTGSGKSTLLHAIIVNLALYYGPEEVQFYLIDFKKGVEFKPYASHSLPHARVIAIESEREFGLSVLERLDWELKRRGDLYRASGVQDLKGFRDANPDVVLPRILLLIDEFQEFFVVDDKIAGDSALLLDRLVRQGRAFGIHVLLGSQTLAGAYTLARSTIGQMAVRIALQCSEADAHLILSEDNTAARLLNRPGEAIYNDANGLFEGNHPFQVVWLGGQQQDNYLQQLAARAKEKCPALEPPLVFEGNVPADPRDNVLLRKAIENAKQPATTFPTTLTAWLGSAVSIKDPTSFTFRRQSGSNLLVVGQQEELATGLLGNCVIGLLAALAASPPGSRIAILDGTPAESPEYGFWNRLVKAFAGLSLPCELWLLALRDVAETIAEFATEVKRRQQSPEEIAPAWILLVHNLGRFRDLRRAEDEFSFSRMDDDESAAGNPGKQFPNVLRDGPGVGVHTLIWCDTYNNVSRWLERQTLRDLDLRALFQMSATDSSNLMDSPLASRLGANRAILYSEELVQNEKFRPYGTPSPEWLAWVREQLAANSVE